MKTRPDEEFAPAMTQRQVADHLGMTQQSVQQFEKSALAKIKRFFEWEAATRGVSVGRLLSEIVE
jgi:transcriptional regulator with XRE-family HTH domain